LTGSGDVANPNWSRQFTSVGAVKRAEQTWGKLGRKDIVDRMYLDPKLAFPLGPLVRGDWGADVAHPPEIPLLGEHKAAPADTDTTTEPSKEDLPAAEQPAGDVFDNRRPSTSTQGLPDLSRPHAAARQPRRTNVPEFKLFRFFDFDVEPGKRYCYRLCLVLANPNLEIPTRFLSDPAMTNRVYLQTAWTEQPVVAAVPRDTKLLALSVSPPTASRPDDEPKASVAIIRWVAAYGIEASKKFSSITRGKLVNFEDDFTYDKDSSIPVEYHTNAIALDMRGGERLPGTSRLNEPGEFLFLDANGTLVVHSEVDDLLEYERSQIGNAAGNAARARVEGSSGEGDLDSQLGLP